MSAREPAAPLFGLVRPVHWLMIDLLAAVGYGMLAFVVLGNGASSAGGWSAAAGGAVCLAVPVGARRRAPLASLAALLVTLVVCAVFAPSATVMALPPLVLVLYTVGARTRFAAAVGALVVASGTVLVTTVPDVLHPGGIAVAVPVFVVSWSLGAVFGLHRRHLLAQLELHDRLRWAQVRRAELELVEQRVRIARELHDVVAHGMSVITVQAGFAGLVVDDHAEVRSALRSIETTGRQTLNEMRTLLEVLRDGADQTENQLLPAPQLRDLDALIDRTRTGGVDVTLTRGGNVTDLPPLVELNAYRIVQEALTNVVKHAGPVSATVAVEYDASQLTITVRNDGPPSPDRVVVTGHGITGMHERARILSGTLDAGPLPNGGYKVVGRLPLSNQSPTLRTIAAAPA